MTPQWLEVAAAAAPAIGVALAVVHERIRPTHATRCCPITAGPFDNPQRCTCRCRGCRAGCNRGVGER